MDSQSSTSHPRPIDAMNLPPPQQAAVTAAAADDVGSPSRRWTRKRKVLPPSAADSATPIRSNLGRGTRGGATKEEGVEDEERASKSSWLGDANFANWADLVPNRRRRVGPIRTSSTSPDATKRQGGTDRPLHDGGMAVTAHGAPDSSSSSSSLYSSAFASSASSSSASPAAGAIPPPDRALPLFSRQRTHFIPIHTARPVVAPAAVDSRGHRFPEAAILNAATTADMLQFREEMKREWSSAGVHSAAVVVPSPEKGRRESGARDDRDDEGSRCGLHLGSFDQELIGAYRCDGDRNREVGIPPGPRPGATTPDASTPTGSISTSTAAAAAPVVAAASPRRSPFRRPSPVPPCPRRVSASSPLRGGDGDDDGPTATAARCALWMMEDLTLLSPIVGDDGGGGCDSYEPSGRGGVPICLAVPPPTILRRRITLDASGLGRQQ